MKTTLFHEMNDSEFEHELACIATVFGVQVVWQNMWRHVLVKAWLKQIWEVSSRTLSFCASVVETCVSHQFFQPRGVGEEPVPAHCCARALECDSFQLALPTLGGTCSKARAVFFSMLECSSAGRRKVLDSLRNCARVKPNVGALGAVCDVEVHALYS